MNSYKKFIIALGALLLLAAALYGASFLLVRPSDQTSSPPEQTNQTLTLKGKIICLPHKDQSGPQTLECAFGLQTDQQKNYGLKNAPAPMPDVNTQVEVTGTLEQPDANELYDVEANITVTSITEQ